VDFDSYERDDKTARKRIQESMRDLVDAVPGTPQNDCRPLVRKSKCASEGIFNQLSLQLCQKQPVTV
jgi:hypothetical protein